MIQDIQQKLKDKLFHLASKGKKMKQVSYKLKENGFNKCKILHIVKNNKYQKKKRVS